MKQPLQQIKNGKVDLYTKPKILVLLYGDFDYDGRVQRLVNVLAKLGEVIVLDVAETQIIEGNLGCLRERLHPASNWGNVRRHLAFWTAALRCSNAIRPQVVMAANFFSAFPGRIAASLSGARLVYDPYELIIPELGRRMPLRDLIWYWLERLVVQRAEVVIAANTFRAEKMRQHYGLSVMPAVFRNIPMPTVKFVDSPLTGSLPEPEAGKIRILYQGDMNLDRGIGRFIEAVRFLPKTMRLILAGAGPDLDRIRSRVIELALEDQVLCLGRIPNRDLPSITRRCHVGIVTYPYQGLNNIHCSPNKIFEYAQAGLPVVATDQPPLQYMVKDFGIGELIAEDDSPMVVARAITRLAENIENYSRNIKYFLEEHSWETEAALLYTALQPVIDRR